MSATTKSATGETIKAFLQLDQSSKQLNRTDVLVLASATPDIHLMPPSSNSYRLLCSSCESESNQGIFNRKILSNISIHPV